MPSKNAPHQRLHRRGRTAPRAAASAAYVKNHDIYVFCSIGDIEERIRDGMPIMDNAVKVVQVGM